MTTRPIQPNDLFALSFLQGATLAPDGRSVVYTLAHYDGDEDTDYHHLWILDVQTGQSRQLTQGKQSNKEPRWSPDGKTIAFLSTRTPKAQIFLLPVDGGEARQITDLKQGVATGPVWSPDGTKIAFTAAPELEKQPDLTKPYRLTRHIYRFDGIGYLDPAVQDLYVVPAVGGDAQRLTNDATHNSAPQWSPNGQELLFVAAMRPDQHASLQPALCVVNLAGQVRTLVDRQWGQWTGSAAWLPNGTQIAAIGTPAGKPIGSKAELWIVNTQGAPNPVSRTATLPYGLGGRLQADMPANFLFGASKLAISNDGQNAFAQVQIGGTVQLYRIALAGPEAHTAVAAGDRSCLLLELGSDQHSLLYAATTLSDPPDLYLADLANQTERQLTTLNADLLATVQKPTIKRLFFPSKDNELVEGWMILPATGQPPYPTVLYIHGGPHSAFGQIYHFDTQMLVSAGYAVLMVNHRASTGYGDAFATAIKGDWGNLDYADLMAGVDAAITQGWANADRLGVCGLSGGGNLSCWIVGQTNRFKAAVPENPVTNWLSFYGVSDIGVWFAVEELGGHPYEIPETYLRCSPITYAHRCQTPTLLVQGEQDWRCPAEQAEQFYNVLKANGCVVEMVRLPGSAHAGAIAGPPMLRRAQNEALLDWMRRYV